MSLGVETGLAELTARLVNAEDRERFAQLVTYAHSLPDGDEFRQLMELLGLVSLLGQRIPEAAGELLIELRQLSRATGEQNARIEARLAALPGEVVQGVNVAELAAGLSELLRQSLAKLGLRESIQVLESASKALNGVAGELSANLAPAARQIRTVTTSVSTEVAKLNAAAVQLQKASAELAAHGQFSRGFLQVWLALGLFLAGGFAGIFLWEKAHSPLGVAVTSIHEAKKGIHTK